MRRGAKKYLIVIVGTGVSYEIYSISVGMFGFNKLWGG